MNFINAFRFLTIIPLPLKSPAREENIGRSLAYFPLVGLLIGLLLAGFDRALSLILPQPVVTGLVVASLAVLTGALHLDGFMDSMDGLFLSGGPQRRLEVMKDSRVGSFGVVGAVLLLLLKYLCLQNLPESSRPFALVLMPVLSRWCVVWPVSVFPPAKPQGLAQSFKLGATRGRAVIATLLALAVSMAVFRVQGVIIMAGLFIITMLAALFINRRLSGLTGDSYGAMIEAGDLSVLLLVIILTSPG